MAVNFFRRDDRDPNFVLFEMLDLERLLLYKVGAARLIENFGSTEDRALFCERMYSGLWGGTMCLTEPDAGSDVGYLKTKAIPDRNSLK